MVEHIAELCAYLHAFLFGDRKALQYLQVDIVDWIERLPISETRFYVQRVMENMQVYQTLAEGNHGLTIEADLVRGRLN